MRTSMAFFAGVGTVFVAVAAGVGGGLTIANIMSPQAPQEHSKVERRGSTEPSTSTKDPLVPVPYMAATQASSKGPVVVSPAPNAQAAQNEAGASAPKAAAPAAQIPEVTASNDRAAASQAVASPDANAKPGASRSAETSQPADASKPSEISKPSEAPKPSEASKPTEASTAKPSSSSTQAVAVREQPASPDDANTNAKARDTDMKRAERRRTDRHQQWVDRRRYQSRDQELRDVEARVREDTETREVYVERPVRVEYPQVRLFGSE
jgi:hypothetical protein